MKSDRPPENAFDDDDDDDDDGGSGGGSDDDVEDGGLLEISHDPKVLELGAKGHPASGEH